jgi:uncharacterized protein (TIGR03435 family)
MRLAPLLACAALAFAQEPAFEVATLKPSTPQDHFIALSTYPGGRITITNYPLYAMLLEAFHVQAFQIVGGPRWTHEDRYNVEAKPPASSAAAKFMPAYPKVPPTDEQRRMLQTLLVDRFHIQFHRESRQGPVYLLTRGPKELKLQPAKDPDEYPWAGSLAGGGFGGDGMRGTNITMPLLAERLSPYMERPVIDKTGLTGSFDFRIEFPADPDHPDITASLFACLQALGLKLEAAKAPVQYIVIDHVEKPQ